MSELPTDIELNMDELSHSKRAKTKHKKGPAQAKPPISLLNIELTGAPMEKSKAPNSPVSANTIKRTLISLSQKELPIFLPFDTHFYLLTLFIMVDELGECQKIFSIGSLIT